MLSLRYINKKYKTMEYQTEILIPIFGILAGIIVPIPIKPTKAPTPSNTLPSAKKPSIYRPIPTKVVITPPLR